MSHHANSRIVDELSDEYHELLRLEAIHKENRDALALLKKKKKKLEATYKKIIKCPSTKS